MDRNAGDGRRWDFFRPRPEGIREDGQVRIMDPFFERERAVALIRLALGPAFRDALGAGVSFNDPSRWLDRKSVV